MEEFRKKYEKRFRFTSIMCCILPNVIKLRKRKKVTGTVKVSVTFIMKIFMNRM